MDSFRDELMALLNKHSRESISNTPDFILTDYLKGCLEAFDRAVLQREAWYDREDESDALRMLPDVESPGNANTIR